MKTLLTIAIFIGGAVLILSLLNRLLRLRGSKDESAGSQQHSVDFDTGSGDSGDGGGD
ncbi:MAG TPA: hypothetical protein VFR60_09060 [Sphingomicrobium sp.]|nr:hypothetical protein [Sphingomicrobium sp.]